MRPDASLSAVMRQALALSPLSEAEVVAMAQVKIPSNMEKHPTEKRAELFFFRTVSSTAELFDRFGMALREVFEFTLEPSDGSVHDLGAEAKKIFRSQGKTLAMLAYSLGVSENYIRMALICKFKEGKKNRPLPALARFCRVLNVKLKISLRDPNRTTTQLQSPIDLDLLETALTMSINSLTGLRTMVLAGKSPSQT